MGKNRKADFHSQTSSGDQNTVSGNVSAGGIVMQGRNADITINQNRGLDSGEITQLFEKIYRHIESRQLDPNVDKNEIIETVQKIEGEAKAEDAVNETKLSRWMENLNKMAPDIIDVVLASLGGPVSAAGAILKKIADQIHK